MDIWQIANVLGRLLFSALFLRSAYNHFTQAKAMAGYAQAVGHVPFPAAAVVGSGAMLLLGGLSILLGFHPRIGAGLLFLFLVPVAFIMHGYWRVQDPMARAGDAAQFWKNIALAGAALYIIADPHWPWPWAIG